MRILAQVRKELRQLTRDRLAVALALLLPLIQLTLMGQSLAFIVELSDHSQGSRAHHRADREGTRGGEQRVADAGPLHLAVEDDADQHFRIPGHPGRFNQ